MERSASAVKAAVTLVSAALISAANRDCMARLISANESAIVDSKFPTPVAVGGGAGPLVGVDGRPRWLELWPAEDEDEELAACDDEDEEE